MEHTLEHNRMNDMWIGVSETKMNLDWVPCAEVGLTPTNLSQTLYAEQWRKPTKKNPIRLHNEGHGYN